MPRALFDEADIAELLTNLDPEESTYYKAILQNLFFATLNQEMNPPPYQDVTPLPPYQRGNLRKPPYQGEPTETALSRLSSGKLRKFRGDGRQHYNITSLYRYKRYFKRPRRSTCTFLKRFRSSTAACLNALTNLLPVPVGASSNSRPTPQNILRIDGFSDRDDNPLSVPNELFFSEPQSVNLNAVYDTKNSRYTVRGLIHILNRYKFTIAENTPIEEEVALDPELLGQVFENLLAAYNPETGTTARKQTGSFYTPREVVNYMVDESAACVSPKARFLG